ncbi:hypothetical protein ACIGGE_12420 [Qipengyuania sp. NPDC077410]|uniref:hypothetical protein n=1 Tax=Qipengyuania sp. NPDC077410 TaxID=3364496 RepID=UPI0037C506EF
MAVKFFNHAALFGDVIAMVFPLSFQKVSVQNRLDLNFHLVEEIILPKNAFIFDGKPKHVPTVFQIWVKKDVPREKIKLATSHDDLDFTTWDHANIAISRVGSKAGCLHWDFDKSSQTTFFIRASPKVIKILMSLDLRTPAMRTTGQRSLAKTELIALYVQRKRELARQSLCELDVIGTLNQAHRWAAAICLKNFSSSFGVRWLSPSCYQRTVAAPAAAHVQTYRAAMDDTPGPHRTSFEPHSEHLSRVSTEAICRDHCLRLQSRTNSVGSSTATLPH